MPVEIETRATGCDDTASVGIRLHGVGFAIAQANILSGIDLEIGASPVTVLLGPNGSGKTTLLRLLMGLAQPTSGRIEFASRHDGCRRAFVFQKPVMLKRSAAANITFALRAIGAPAEPDRIRQLLAEVGLAAAAERPARRLSGGEQQRLALARALARQPGILMLDEPTASLDPAQSKLVEEIIATVAASGVRIILSTHDLGQARRLAGDVVFLVRGRLCESGPATRFFNSPETDEARRFLAGDLVL